MMATAQTRVNPTRMASNSADSRRSHPQQPTAHTQLGARRDISRTKKRLYVLEDCAGDGEEGGGDGDAQAEEGGFVHEATYSQSCALYSIPLCLSARIYLQMSVRLYKKDINLG